MTELSLDEIHRRARRGPMLLLLRRALSLIITLLSTILIARLVGPRAYGLAAMSAVVLSFLQVFRDFGLTNAMLRKGVIDEAEVTFLFWFNLLATLTIALLVAIATPAIAAFYHEPVVALTLWVSLAGFIVSGAALQFAAVLKRDLRFDIIATAETLGALVALIAGAILAYFLRNVWAIVAMNIAQALTQAAIYFFSTKWRPGRPRRVAGMRELLHFGANSSIFSLLNFVSRNAATLTVGRIFGPVPLGLYNRANALYQLPLSNLLEPLAQAALPIMARLRQQPDLYRQTYLGLVEKLCCVLVPAGAFVFAAAGPLVVTLLGAKWSETADVLRALAPSLMFYGLFWPTSDLLISQNRSAELRTSGIYDVVLRAGGVLVGAQFSYVGAAIGLAAGTVLTVPVRVGQAGRTGPISAGDQYRAFLPSIPLGLSVVAAVLALEPVSKMLDLSAPLTLLLDVLGAALAAGITAVIVPSTRLVVLDVVQTLTGKYRPTKASAV